MLLLVPYMVSYFMCPLTLPVVVRVLTLPVVACLLTSAVICSLQFHEMFVACIFVSLPLFRLFCSGDALIAGNTCFSPFHTGEWEWRLKFSS